MSDYYCTSLVLNLIESYLSNKEFLKLRCVNKLWYECITAQKTHKFILRIPNSSINEEEATLFQHEIAIREIVLEYKNSKFVHVNYCRLLSSFYHRVVG